MGLVHKFADDERKKDHLRAQKIENEYKKQQAQIRASADMGNSRTIEDPRALEAEYNRTRNRVRSAAMAGRSGDDADRQYF